MGRKKRKHQYNDKEKKVDQTSEGPDARKKGETREHDRHAHGGHFIIPKSRGGTREPGNVYTAWAARNHPLHVAWHVLFGDALPEEAVNQVRSWTRKDGEWDKRYFTKSDGSPNNKMNARKKLFNDMKPVQVIEWIEREFIRKEWFEKKGDDS